MIIWNKDSSEEKLVRCNLLKHLENVSKYEGFSSEMQFNLIVFLALSL